MPQENRGRAVNGHMRKRLLPLGIKNQVKTELPALVALEAIGKPWFCEQHLTDLMALAMVCQVVAEEGSEVHTAACELFVVLSAPQLDGVAIKPLVTLTNSWVQRQPNGKIQAAVDRLMGTVAKAP